MEGHTKRVPKPTGREELDLTKELPDILVHVTKRQFVRSIMTEGLLPQGRNNAQLAFASDMITLA